MEEGQPNFLVHLISSTSVSYMIIAIMDCNEENQDYRGARQDVYITKYFCRICDIAANIEAFSLLLNVYQHYALFVTNTYIFTISCYTEMNEQRTVIAIRHKGNKTVDLEGPIIDELVVVEMSPKNVGQMLYAFSDIQS